MDLSNLIIPLNLIKSKQSHNVYILSSTVSKKTYVGYTVNLKRRLRQHNGEIKGGAKKTSVGRPWKVICYISGFPDNHTALRCEWVNNHPKMMGLTFRSSIRGRIKTMIDGLTYKDKFTSNTEYYTKDLNLVWNWVTHGYKLSDFNFNMPNVREEYH